jgi:hypothetical protein
MRKLLIGFLIFGFSKVQANTLVIPYPALLEEEGMLQPSVLLGKPGFTFEGVLSSERTPSRLTLAGAFPLMKQDTLRGSGWMWALRSGITDSIYEEGKVFAAGQYFLEAGLGRGTASPLFEAKTGLRGFMELSFRNDRPKLSPAVRDIAGKLNREIQANKMFLSIKIGAGSAHDAEGIVAQPPSQWALRLQSQIYLPIKSEGASILNVVGQTYRACWSQIWLCGFQASFQHHYEVKQGSLYEELSDVAGLSAFVSLYLKEDIVYTTRVSWPYIGNSRHEGFESFPLVNLRLTKAF